jgi:8-oxo-dGTP pyrophosphatase MutT (NUDIX family)
MVRRHALSDFAADVYVFPGGKVDPGDRDAAAIVSPRTGGEIDLVPFRVAAIRELFEEAGVLLAHDTSHEILRFDAANRLRYEASRLRVHAGDMSILELAREEGLELAAERLTPISRWITPESFPRRFDTYFFLAALPDGQEPLHDAVETVDGVWIEPEIALDRFLRGEFPLVFATERHLERLARCPTPEEAAYGANLEPVMPRPVKQDGRTVFLIPGDEGYEDG